MERYVHAWAGELLGTERQQAQHWALVDAITQCGKARPQDIITAQFRRP
jgi:alpha-D-ribose 1-methylphosphonate 5-triphosphate synthase subunit PhnG